MVVKEVVQEVSYTVLKRGLEDIRKVIKANLGTRVSIFDLPNVKLPTGGGQTWQSDLGLDSSFEVIILKWHDSRSYWPNAFSGKTPPSCWSADGVIGTDGTDCTTCEKAQYGSKGRGQACKLTRNLFLLLPDRILPVILTLPPTSIRNCARYFTELVSLGQPFSGVVTQVTLDKTTNSAGIGYSIAAFELVRQLSPEEAEKMEAYVEATGELISIPPSVPVSADENGSLFGRPWSEKQEEGAVLSERGGS